MYRCRMSSRCVEHLDLLLEIECRLTLACVLIKCPSLLLWLGATITIPYLKVLVPESGCRVILATDGLWDVLNRTKVVRLTRDLEAQGAAEELVR